MRLIWDKIGERFYETGTDHGVLYPQEAGEYPVGIAWNGLTAISDSPSGAEANPQYADNIKYLNLLSAEEYGCTIEAFTFPDEFAACNGLMESTPGVMLGQQTRKPFGLVWRTLIGNDTDGNDHGYKLHLVYNALAAPSESSYTTVSDSPEPINMSWEITTTPVAVSLPGAKPTAKIVIDSRTVDKTKLEELESILFGTTDTEAKLILPDEVFTIFAP